MAPLLLALLMLAAQLAGDAGRQWWGLNRDAVAAGEFWRLLTGNFVHLGWYHWLLNSLGLLLLVLLCPEPIRGWIWVRRLLLLSLAVGAGIYLWVPQIQNYAGLSGVLHGLFILGLAPQALRRDPIAIACLLLLVGKIAYELIYGASLSDADAIGGRVAVEAHFFGVVAALAYGLVFRSFSGRETHPAASTHIPEDQNPTP